MPIRVHSDVEELAECYVDVSERWSIDDFSLMFKDRQGFIDVFRRRVVGCHLLTADDELINDPLQAIDRFGELDLRLAFLVNNALTTATDHLATLGKAIKLASSGAGGPATTTTTAPNSTTSRIVQPE